MLLYITEFLGKEAKRPRKYPCAVMVQDNWDDYGFKTTFSCVLHLSHSEQIDLGNIKILHINQSSGLTPIPEKELESLSEDYVSLGRSLQYYETLLSRGPDIYKPFLGALRDAAFDPVHAARFEHLPGFKNSLLRSAGDERTLQDARRFFQSEDPIPDYDNGFEFTFRTPASIGASTLIVKFDFTKTEGLPHRLIALIGYNGTGKTRLLANLAIAATRYDESGLDESIDDDEWEARHGGFMGAKPPFQTAIVVSYSAFDTFAIPSRHAQERAQLDSSRLIQGYIYCGLREISDSKDPDGGYRMKSPSEIEDSLLSALRTIGLRERTDILHAAMRPFLHDTSFTRIGISDFYQTSDYEVVRAAFRRLSSGHKVVLKIIVQLVAYIDTAPTLVLIDEPETHLHPPLLASFLRSIRTCLVRLNAYAIVATHSPVVLQETPAKYVRVLRRFNGNSSVALPSVETFGENIGVITQEAFNLDDSATDWHATLATMAQHMTAEEIEDTFERGLGFAARSYIAGLRYDAGNGEGGD